MAPLTTEPEMLLTPMMVVVIKTLEIKPMAQTELRRTESVTRLT
jgi:hypothetical protein